jgi:hypothetical protein
MYYKDEFGLKVNIPALPHESAIEGIKSSRETLIEMLTLFDSRSTSKNSCMNPMMRRVNDV